MKSVELKQRRDGLLAELDVLANKAEKLTDEETSRWEKLYQDVDGMNRDIKFEEQKESVQRIKAAQSTLDVSTKEVRTLQQYSFVKAIQEFMRTGRLTGLEAEMHQEAEREMSLIGQNVSGFGVPSKVLRIGSQSRAVVTTGTAPMVPTDMIGFIDALYAKLVCVNLGATVWSGLTANLSVPRVATAATAGWATEVADAGDAGSDTEAVTITPKRLTCYQDISKLLILQSPYNVEGIMRNLFISAMQVALDNAHLEGASNGPTGILATSGIGDVAGGTNGVAPTLANILALTKEVAIDNADFGKLAFATNPKARWKLMSTAIESGHPERVWNVLQPDMLLGYRAAVSTAVPGDLTKGSASGTCSAIIFGNWEEMIIAQFGGLDITVDQYSQAIGNKVRIVLNSFWDSVLKHPASFAAMKDALCDS
jgi:HK97 family phage major capsid protein